MSVEIPGYKIIRILGKGGMATVYLAEQDVFEREIALKVMSRVLDEDSNFGQRFFREARIVSKLVHPNIVTVHDVGKHDGHLYLSMEYIDGRDLKYVHPSLNLRQKICAVRDVAKALDYAGSKGYVHRDIKPENIMLHSSDGRAVLMDFGIARAVESDTSVTQVGTAIGTPHYMSPEQAKGRAVDNRSDIYSLGVVFYFLLAGKVPFDGESAVAIGIKHITELPPLLPNGFEGLQPILDTMLAKDVKNRYQTAKDLIRDLGDLDVTLLEHTIDIAKQQTRQQHAAGTETPALLSHVGDVHAEEFELGEDECPSLDQFPLYEDEDTHIRERTPVLPWFLAMSFVVAVFVSFIHIKNPQLASPWLEKAKHGIGEMQEKIQHFIDARGDKKSIEIQNDETNGAGLSAGDEPKQPGDVSVGAQTQQLPASDSSFDGSFVSPSETVSDARTAKLTAQQIGSTLDPESAKLLTGLLKKFSRLQDAYALDSIHLAELVATYREVMVIAPAEHPAHVAFVSLREEEFGQALALGEKSGGTHSFESRFEQLHMLFPEVEQEVYDNIVAAGKRLKKILNLNLEAQAYLLQNNLTQPAQRNAFASYQKVLALDSENIEALAGLQAIAEKLYQLALKKQQRNDRQGALQTLDKALELYPQNEQAQALKNKISRATAQQKKIRELISGANQKIDRGQLFTPRKLAAYYDYQQVLALEPNNTRAKEGVDRVVDALSSKVWQLVSAEQFLQAKEFMQAPLAELPEHPRVHSLSLALDEVIGEKVLDLQPRIGAMVVKGDAIADVVVDEVTPFSADRSIYIGFRYKNFQSTTTVVQAVLLDGAGQLQIAQVPVVVEGQQGLSIFQIDRPVEGFSVGSYTIELRLGQETLRSLVFNVKGAN
ncbi:MAG: serine/threonine protein kinase/tetratricopeptide (TPR) repeat protein [Lentisphaeria bacterium]|jgi:serine/threonine protein kinase/tetratricopeptide (TPR) repeat protein